MFFGRIAEYSKRLSRFCEFKIIEAAEENFTKVNAAQVEIIKEKEADNILPHLKGYVYAAAIEGKMRASEKFAEELSALISEGREITFVIGGSYGLSDRVKRRADSLISFSDMTFPHAMFRVMLCEQIYRAFSINAGTPYHK